MTTLAVSTGGSALLDQKYQLKNVSVNNDKGVQIAVKKWAVELEMLKNPGIGKRAKRGNTKGSIDWDHLISNFVSAVNKKATSVIYKITNLKEKNINGVHKFYIGKTKKSLENRMKGHCKAAYQNKGCPRLGKSIRHYGINSFKVDILYQGRGINKKEHEFIASANATNPSIAYNVVK